MKFTIPILVNEWDQGNGSGTRFRVEAMFAGKLSSESDRLSRALDSIANRLRKELQEALKSFDQVMVQTLAFNPVVRIVRARVDVEAGGKSYRGMIPLVCYRSPAGEVVYSPVLPEVRFQVHQQDKIALRAELVFRQWFQKQEKERGYADPGILAGQGTYRLTDLELELQPGTPKAAEESRGFLGLLGAESGDMDGEQELAKTSRRLDDAYPSDLHRALFRDELVERLGQLLENEGETRAVMLVGPRGCGKTTLIHELVYRRVEKRGGKYKQRGSTWQLEPQRLIAGMSYVGQWENRVQAILSHARSRELLLVFNDPIGLFRAGNTSNSNQSVGSLLKNSLEEPGLLLLGECTPDVFQRLQEVDRGFADLFEVLRVDPPSREESMKILLHVERELEKVHRCRINEDVLDVLDRLESRFHPQVEMPGRLAVALRAVASRHHGREVSQRTILLDTMARYGVEPGFLQPMHIPLETIISGLERRVVGQESAVRITSERIQLAMAGLCDPGRPLASLLFAGPTGVGKTELAKAVAETLFGTDTKLLRFDMNEYLDPYSVTRLVGTLENPEGLLTSAVRNRPVNVLLFDEIEKAHPDVFDLLLQVLGEGRLTDAVGQTVSFANCFIVMTSNLGVRESTRGLGFTAGSKDREKGYEEAVRKHFRPEFFNRLDRVVVFQNLGPAEARKIASIALGQVMKRDGLARRQVVLQVQEAVLEHIALGGYQVDQGARSMRRIIEKELVQQVAVPLARMKGGTPVLVRMQLEGDPARVNVVTTELKVATVKSGGWFDLLPKDNAEAAGFLLALQGRVQRKLEKLAPRKTINVADPGTEVLLYYALRQKLEKLEGRMTRLQAEITRALEGRSTLDTGNQVRRGGNVSSRDLKRVSPDSARLKSEYDGSAQLREQLWDLYESTVEDSPGYGVALGLMQEFLLIDCMSVHRVPGRVLFLVEMLAAAHVQSGMELGSVVYCWRTFFHGVLRLEMSEWERHPRYYCCVIEGPGAEAYAQMEAGLHMILQGYGEPLVLLVRAVSLETGDNPSEVRDRLVEKGPSTIPPIIRTWDAGKVTLDHRSGCMVPGIPGPDAMIRFMTSLLRGPSSAAKTQGGAKGGRD